jgi:3-oxoacyl-[acyl-carrier protein] reductase
MRGATVVSGGSRGLGLVLVERLLAGGRSVATFSRSGSDRLASLGRRYGCQLHEAKLDAADPFAIRSFIATATECFGSLDHCVANAGHAVPGMLATASDEAIETMLAVNLRGAIVLVREVIRQMLADPIRTTSPPAPAGGSLTRKAVVGVEKPANEKRDRAIVVVSSAVGRQGSPGLAVYAATKAGLEGFARSLAREVGPRSIRVNAVAPGFFASDLSASLADDHRQRIIRRTALGRLATADDVVNTIEFLISPHAALITGQVVAVDGGGG